MRYGFSWAPLEWGKNERVRMVVDSQGHAVDSQGHAVCLSRSTTGSETRESGLRKTLGRGKRRQT